MAATGARRWADPEDAHSAIEGGVPMAGCFSGTFDASRYGPVCPQAESRGGAISKYETQSEDCLHLNVFAPQVEAEEAAAGMAPLLPVIVFLHGGGNTEGAGSRYDMAQVAERGFIAITLNYRLGALGFLVSDALASGGGPNLGLKDILLALAWVKRNVRGFGGDASRVTLVGHGSGAANAIALSASPRAVQDGEKLFAGVLALSPGPRFGQLRSKAAEAQKVFSANVGCAEEGDHEETCLRALSVGQVLAASPLRSAPWWDATAEGPADENDLPTSGGRRAGLLVIDGDVVTAESWVAMGKRDRALHVPMMLTAMAAEPDARPAHRVHNAAQYAAAVRSRLGSLGSFWTATRGDVSFADEALAQYPVERFSTPQLALEAMVTDVRHVCGMKRIAGMAASSGPEPVFMGVNFLRLSEPVAFLGLSSSGIAAATEENVMRAVAPGHKSTQAFHGLDVMLWMADESRYKLAPVDADKARNLQSAFDAFVRTGSPEGYGQFGPPSEYSFSWKPVKDSPNFDVTDPLNFPVNIDVATIGHEEINMSYNFNDEQCAFWARDAMDRNFAASA